jgi:hypothetical protein
MTSMRLVPYHRTGKVLASRIMSHSSELRTKLVQGIQELESDLDRLRGALAALDGGSYASRAVAEPGAPRRRSRRRNHGSEIVPAGKIESLLAAHDGITTAELARETNGGHEQILSLLKELEQAGKAHRSGTRRSTRWHAGSGSTQASSNGSNGAAAFTAHNAETTAGSAA